MSAASATPPPSKPQALLHLAQARQNHDLYQQLKREGKHLDWAVTVLFYTALHLIQAYLVELAATGFDIPKDHEDRDRYVRRKLTPIFSDYSLLQTRSNWARYQPNKPKPTVDLVQEYQDLQFARIVAHLRQLGVRLEQ